MKRWSALLLVVLALFTLAPRTSQPLGSGWTADVAGNFDRVTSTKSLVVTLTPGPGDWVEATLTIAPGTADWTPISLSDGCGRSGDNIVCEFANTGELKQILIRAVVRTETPRVLGSQLTLDFGG